MKNLLALSLMAAAPLSAAHPGQAPYELYCGACHAPDGKGISGGQFPPLAASEWVKGKPERVIEIVLHGIQGKLQVAGKDFNLAMPPHKDSLTDDQISNIISYVRSSWGHKESAVTKQQIAAMRKSTAKQKDMWQAAKLLKKYPIQKPPAIRDLLSYTHLGSFKTLADLRKTKAVNAEEEKKGLISLQHAALEKKARDNYGIVWEGWLNVPRDGKYTFTYDTDDGGAVTIGGKEIITRNYVGPAGKPTRKSIKLEKGRVDIRIEYFELSGNEHISLSWEGPKMKKQYLSDTKSSGGGGGGGGKSIPVVAPEGEAIIYRNFIAGTDPRGIGVGYSEGVNLAFSADSMSLDMIWKGDFIDGGRHWINRGQGFQPPAGDQLMTINRGIPFTVLESQTSSWPDKADEKMQPRFYGYSLNKQQQPTFKYRFGPVKVFDTPTPKSDGSGFTRTIEINVPSPGSADQQLYFRALSGGSVQSGGERTFSFEGDLAVNVPSSKLPPFTRENELLVPIPLTPGKHAVTIDYTWK